MLGAQGTCTAGAAAHAHRPPARCRPADQDRRDRFLLDRRRRRELARRLLSEPAGRRTAPTDFRDHEITVLNRGVNGEEARDMLARFETTVIAEKPDLVLWQVGTNSRAARSSASRRRSSLHRAGYRAAEGSGRRRHSDRPAIRAEGDRQAAMSQHGRAAATRTRKAIQRQPVPALRGDAPLARAPGHAVRDVRLARRAAHERLELCLRAQAPGRAHRGGRRRRSGVAAPHRGAR